MALQETTIERLQSAFANGVKISKICALSGVARWKLNGLTSSAKSYNRGTSLTDEECADVCRALDVIKGAL